MRAPTIRMGELSLSRLGFGSMSLTGRGTWGAPMDVDAAKGVLRRAVDLGADFVDTADSYGPNVAEELAAQALHPYEGVVVATKGGFTRQGPGRWSRNGRPDYLREACHASLRRLRVERIELYQLHAVDPDVPIEESVGALTELRAEGKIRHVGVCNVDADQLARARAVEPVVSVQNRFSLADRSSQDVLDVCERDGLGFIAWAPLAKGSLTQADETLDTIASAHEATAAQIALAWILAKSPATVPIPGTASAAHLEEDLAASEVELSQDELALLDRTVFAMPNRSRAGGVRRRLRRLVRR